VSSLASLDIGRRGYVEVPRIRDLVVQSQLQTRLGFKDLGFDLFDVNKCLVGSKE
jgi:hypothetical protein